MLSSFGAETIKANYGLTIGDVLFPQNNTKHLKIYKYLGGLCGFALEIYSMYHAKTPRTQRKDRNRENILYKNLGGLCGFA